MKSIVIQASARTAGDTSLIVQSVAHKLGCPVVDLLNIDFSGYDYDQRNQNDEFLPLMRRLVAYDCLVFITPVYWYSMSGLLKNFFDRITDCLKIDKETGRKLRGMHMAALSCSNSPGETEGFFFPFSASAEYLGMHYLGGLHCYVEDGEIPGEVAEAIDKFLKAFETSKN